MPTGYVVVEYGISILKTLHNSLVLYIFTGDVTVECGTLDPYWGRCGI